MKVRELITPKGKEQSFLMEPKPGAVTWERFAGLPEEPRIAPWGYVPQNVTYQWKQDLINELLRSASGDSTAAGQTTVRISGSDLPAHTHPPSDISATQAQATISGYDFRYDTGSGEIQKKRTDWIVSYPIGLVTILKSESGWEVVTQAVESC